MAGTRRVPLRRPVLQQISMRAIELFRELERARRARRRAVDCSVSRYGLCSAQCGACMAWWDAHDALHSELRLRPWQWPALPKNPYPPRSPAARKWRPSDAQRALQDQLEAARRAAIN
jgi:hypothetical protein